ncbi:hypothetical protein COW36_23505 [bacterium (Candidatus Blackallbacteria) CG17_big_fil_post_rev_8_21_14_2_50_48_46]|uniref:Class I SAM-dependent methyltransferase n=1 Tax=bacterium (Candidatus Blackallbacteria) CG17_big_fil_post_rev_8_21_14_2_50_48_46 TaxID=2014261 RepID=A0A2M7FXL8_9BACT|nr:MAG: hypothetical protein COW64_17715 [bacterium (Candidatus Blackallbacteria) CG18_big_fil_WC_8_21_14_2_50_49_26]PIW14008.1 MAG: hypothetical protein COW36_23505 [bacterium (Candidatus Blackallbacteria) CG17_big_fil_post_rev_8_21_14_2_50_48_46]PIW46860.1 MAG: hypothetical protein COW20_14680 [bacterium (Candidatus Blackallbacteria) CG13_big_fil_rev_8_21_14_2_50_49_14]
MTYLFHYDWFSPYLSELEPWILPLAGQTGLKILEIGSFEGRSAVWFLEQVLTGPEAALTCIDPWQVTPEMIEFEPEVMLAWAEARFDSNTALALQKSPARLIKIKASSEVALPGLPAESYDLIYLDGSHRARYVLSDLVLAWRLLKPEGLLCCDDYGYRRFQDPAWNPALAIDSFLACYQGFYQLLHQGYQVILRKTGDGGPVSQRWEE